MKVMSYLFAFMVAWSAVPVLAMEPDAAPVLPVPALPVVAQPQAAAVDQEEPCSICLEDMRNKVAPEVVTLHCGHKFCTNCIASVEPRQANIFAVGNAQFRCPNCRADYTANDIARIRTAYTRFNGAGARIIKLKAINTAVTITALCLGLYGVYHLYYEQLPMELDIEKNKNPIHRARNLAWAGYKAIIGIGHGWYLPSSSGWNEIINAMVDGYGEARSIENNVPVDIQNYNQRAVGMYNGQRRYASIVSHCLIMYYGMNKIKGYAARVYGVADGLPAIFNNNAQ